MLFPVTERHVYKRNTLDRVICQFKFPAVLKIEDSSPTEFQELLRNEYPNYEERIEKNINLPIEVLNSLPSFPIEQMGIPITNKIHIFSSKDRIWSINLSKSFLSLTCNEYTMWEDFKRHMEISLQGLCDIYKPSFFSRIGLRYVNIINRTNLGIADENWTNLLSHYLLGFCSYSEEFYNSVEGSLQNLKIDLGDNDGNVQISHGFVTESNTKEQCYIIDSDFFTVEEKGIDDGINLLDKFSNEGRNFFQFCIKDRLREVMD